MTTRTLRERTAANSSRAAAVSSSRVAMELKSVGRVGNSDPRFERARPLAEDQADAAGGSVHQEGVAARDLVGAADEKMRREPLQHQRRRRLVRDAARHFHDALRRNIAQLAVGARDGVDIRDALADLEAAHAAAE